MSSSSNQPSSLTAPTSKPSAGSASATISSNDFGLLAGLPPSIVPTSRVAPNSAGFSMPLPRRPSTPVPSSGAPYAMHLNLSPDSSESPALAESDADPIDLSSGSVAPVSNANHIDAPPGSGSSDSVTSQPPASGGRFVEARMDRLEASNSLEGFPSFVASPLSFLRTSPTSSVSGSPVLPLPGTGSTSFAAAPSSPPKSGPTSRVAASAGGISGMFSRFLGGLSNGTSSGPAAPVGGPPGSTTITTLQPLSSPKPSSS